MIGWEEADNRETLRCRKMLMLLAWVTYVTELGKEELQVLGEKY